MAYYKVIINNRVTVIRTEADLTVIEESYKDNLIGMCDQYGNLLGPYRSPGVRALLEATTSKLNGRYQYCGKTLSFIDIQDPTKPVDWFEVERDCAKEIAKDPQMPPEPTYGEAIQTDKKDLGLGKFELPPIWNLAGVCSWYEPNYKRRWKIEINGSTYWIYAMHDSQVEHYTKLYGEGEAPKLIEYKIKTHQHDPVEEAFEVQTPVTPEEVGLYTDDRAAILASLRGMSFSRSKPTSKGGFTLPMHEGVQLSRQIERYRQILISVVGENVSQMLNDADLLKVMPHVLETFKRVSGLPPKLYAWVFGEESTNQPDHVELTPIEEAAMEAPVMTVAEFKVNFPQYPIEVYHDYLRSKMQAFAKANKPFRITDQDTLTEAQNAIQGKSPYQLWEEQTCNKGKSEEEFLDSLHSVVEIDPNDTNPLSESTVREHRKAILKLMDEWWVDIQCETDLIDLFGTNRLEFIRKEYSRYRKYVKRLLLEIIEPTDTQDDFKIDRTEKGTFNLLGKSPDGKWFRPLALTFNTRGHFELFEGVDD